MIERAPAKINLALHLRRRRGDGYHDLETLFVFSDFGDALEVGAETGLHLSVTGPFATAAVGGGDNLVLRAARVLADAAGLPGDARLTLDKHIPVAAGLGGGSVDAAATLRVLNRFWGLDWPLERLAEIGATLGADVPACVHGQTVAGNGRGDILSPVDPAVADDIAGTPILLVNPRVAVSTGPVFAAWNGVDLGPLEHTAWRRARNDLTRPATGLAPVIADVLATLEKSGAALARMSGSGATCFALFDDITSRDQVAADIALQHASWWIKVSTLL